MMPLYVVAAILLGGSTSAGATATLEPCKPANLSASVERLVAPILTEKIAAYREEYNPDGTWIGESQHTRNFELLFYRLLDTKSQAADEALAVLVRFHLGSHPGEERECEIVHRGNQMLPYLKRYRDCLPVTGAEPIPEKMVSTPGFFADLTTDIGRGETCDRD